MQGRRPAVAEAPGRRRLPGQRKRRRGQRVRALPRAEARRDPAAAEGRGRRLSDRRHAARADGRAAACELPGRRRREVDEDLGALPADRRPVREGRGRPDRPDDRSRELGSDPVFREPVRADQDRSAAPAGVPGSRDDYRDDGTSAGHDGPRSDAAHRNDDERFDGFVQRHHVPEQRRDRDEDDPVGRKAAVALLAVRGSVRRPADRDPSHAAEQARSEHRRSDRRRDRQRPHDRLGHGRDALREDEPAGRDRCALLLGWPAEDGDRLHPDAVEPRGHGQREADRRRNARNPRGDGRVRPGPVDAPVHHGHVRLRQAPGRFERPDA